LIYPIELILHGEIVPKARPRVTVNGTYLPGKYRLWKQSAIIDLKRQYRGDTIRSPVAMHLTLQGKHHRRSDLSNIFGAVEDAIVQAGILADDNMTNIVELTARILYQKNLKPIAFIRIIEIKNEEQNQ
jgi:Holliday junction resolvase RusA-like endonuclease